MLSFVGNNPVAFHGSFFFPSRYIVAVVTFLIMAALQMTFIIIICTAVGIWSIIICSVFLALASLTFIMSSCCDPGIVQRRTQQIDLASTSFLKFCAVCQIWRPPRCKHCRQCDNCVEDFDHHCFYLGNCIGRRNRRCFVLFLLLTALMLFLNTITGAIYEAFTYFLLLDIEPMKPSIGDIFYRHRSGAALVIVAAIFWIILSYLLIWNLIVIGRGQTMVEYIKGTYRTTPNPYDRGLIQNFWLFFTDPIPESQVYNT